MPTFRFLGLPEQQKQNIINTHMAPLVDDELPHPRFGGFPIAKPNELSHYPDYERDRGSVLKKKEQMREAYRANKRADLEAKAAKADDVMAFTVGRKPGQSGTGKRIEFPRGEAVQVSDLHVELIKQLRALSGQIVIKKNRDGKVVSQRKVVDIPLFEELQDGAIAAESKEEGPPWGDGMPTKEEFVDYYEHTLKKDAILAMADGLDPAMKKADLLTLIYTERYEAGD